MTPEQFGPDRPIAAMRAITELREAERAMTGWSDYDTPAMHERLREARNVRAMYAEYGDDFRGH